MNFSGDFGDDAIIWYPASGYLGLSDGTLSNVGNYGNYWSCSTNPNDSFYAYYLYFTSSDNIYPVYSNFLSSGRSVRCLKEQ